MRRPFLLTTALLATAGACGPPLAAQGRPDLDRVLDQWIDGYAKGRLDLRMYAVIRGKVDPVYGRGWLGTRGDKTHRGALADLLDRAVRRSQPADVQQILRLAALGLVDGRATAERPHIAVRRLAGNALAAYGDVPCVDLLVRVAGGDLSAWRRPPQDRLGYRLAAILALGANRRPVVRPALQRLLADAVPLIRTAAAEALGRMENAGALGPLTASLCGERDPVAALAVVQAVQAILRAGGESIGPRDRQAVVRASLAALGGTDWRTDLALVDLLGGLRSAAAIPKLIEVLARPRGGPDTSARLARAALGTLRSLTGAILPDDPARWRSYWEGARDGFTVAPVAKLEPTRTAAGFFGLEVTGSEVVFLVDTSGSMQAEFFAAGDYEPRGDTGKQTRMSVAQRELVKAVDGLPADARFNLVAFSDEVRRWRRTGSRATAVNKKALAEKARALVPAGATNIFGALEAALRLGSLRYGSRYEVPVDEVFLLSDGEPTAGKVTDAVTILQLIQETNRYSRVRIHTIYMGGGGDSPFMQQLAEQSGGRYLRL